MLYKEHGAKDCCSRRVHGSGDAWWSRWGLASFPCEAERAR